jgi:hypothetical protein
MRVGEEGGGGEANSEKFALKNTANCKQFSATFLIIRNGCAK